MIEPCPVCGQRYETFRSPEPMTFAQAYQCQRQRHDRNIRERNDYSQPPRRAAVLGLMRQSKLSAWEEHLRLCDLEAAYAYG